MIELQEQIDIAGRAGFATGGRAEHGETDDALGPKRTLARAGPATPPRGALRTKTLALAR